MSDPDPASMIFFSLLLPLFTLLLTVLFSLCDEAFAAVGETRFRELEEDGSRKAAKILELTAKERQFTTRNRLNTILTVTVTVLLITGMTPIVTNLLMPVIGDSLGHILTALIAYVLTLLVSFVLCGAFAIMLPRRLVHHNPEGVALGLLDLFVFFYTLLYPLYGVCRLITWPIVRLSGMDPREDPDKVTEDDIIELIEDVEESGALEESQKDMLNNIFEFDDITAAEIMTPRTDVTAVEVNESLGEALRLAVDNGYSRLPVYEEDIDHVIGLLYVKDLLPYVGRALPKTVSIRILLRDTYFVPDTKKCDELFEEMNEKHLQMAIVVDEYGGVAGIVTIEDLLESIVGNMQDEFDNEEEEVTQLDEDSFEIDGALSIGELEELLDIELPEGDYDTVAGFLLDQLGHIPEEDEETVITYENLNFTIQEMDDRRIEQVLVCRLPAPDEEKEQEYPSAPPVTPAALLRGMEVWI